MKYQSLIEYALLLALSAFVALVLLGPAYQEITTQFSAVGARFAEVTK